MFCFGKAVIHLPARAAVFSGSRGAKISWNADPSSLMWMLEPLGPLTGGHLQLFAKWPSQSKFAKTPCKNNLHGENTSKLRGSQEVASHHPGFFHCIEQS